MNRLEILLKAYEILENITPLRLDCGSLCDQACCQDEEGSGVDSGMFLFPGEEALFANCEDGFTILPADHIRPDLFLVKCKGTCPRNRRPLACRVFPLTPYLTQNEILLMKMDPRARHLCPLARELTRTSLQPEFTKSVRKVSTILLTDPTIKEYMYDLSRMLDEYSQLPWYQLLICK